MTQPHTARWNIAPSQTSSLTSVRKSLTVEGAHVFLSCTMILPSEVTILTLGASGFGNGCGVNAGRTPVDININKGRTIWVKKDIMNLFIQLVYHNRARGR